MAIDLLSLQPTVITRDLSNKYILLAAPYKYGKTTFMANIPGALILSFEPGLNAHAGIYAQTVTTWSEVKQVLKLLKDPKVREKFHTVCFDTIDLAATLCQEFICSQNGVQSLGDIPYGKAYAMYEAEFQKTLLSIANLGYGMVFACHTEEKEIDLGNEKVITRIQPKLDKRAFSVVNRLVDMIGIGVMEFDESGNAHRMLYTRETPMVRAGNRFTYFPPKIEFSYQAVLDNLVAAIEAEGTNNNATIVDKIEREDFKELNFNELKERAGELWVQNLEKGSTEEEKQEIADRILKKLEMTFGRRIKLSEVTEDQAEVLELAVMEMENMLK